MNLRTLLSAMLFLRCSTWACFGQEDRAADDVAPSPQRQNPVLESLAPSPGATVLPFVPSYGFDLADVGHAVQVSGTAQSKHIWHGFDLMDGHSVFFPAATLTLGDTGFSAKLFGAYAVGGDMGQRDELDGALFYARDLLPDTRYATHGTLNYFYYGKPRVPSQRADAQEIGLGLSWPKLLGDNILEPSYYVGSLWPTEHDSQASGISGFIHVLGLTYNLAVPNPGTQDHPQFFKLYGDVTYNDGFGGAGRGWSHLTFGTSTDLAAGKITITPALNYQIAIDDSITSAHGFWGGLTFRYCF